MKDMMKLPLIHWRKLKLFVQPNTRAYIDVDNRANVAREILKNKRITEAEIEDIKEMSEKERNNGHENSTHKEPRRGKEQFSTPIISNKGRYERHVN